MDEVKRTYRSVETDVKKTARDVDGTDLVDRVGNAGDEARKDLGNLGDDVAMKERPMTPTAPSSTATGEDPATERSPDDASALRSFAADAGERVSDAVGALRATADQVGDRIPVVVDTVRVGALEGARTIQAMPDPNQRLLAAFSLGLGLGLSISGAPRLLVAATLAPAMFVAAMIVSRDGTAAGRP